MKSETYITEITTQKTEKYLSEAGKLGPHLVACLLALCQLRTFLCDFTQVFRYF